MTFTNINCIGKTKVSQGKLDSALKFAVIILFSYHDIPMSTIGYENQNNTG